MRMLNLDAKDEKALTELKREEALEFVKESLEIICQTSPRNFYEIPNLSDLNSLMRLEEQGIYENLKFYIR